MCWTTLKQRAEQLGFDIAFRVRCGGCAGVMPDFRSPTNRDWFFIGNYEHAASVWVRPKNDAARCLMKQHVVAMISDCDSFVEPLADYDLDFFAAAAPWRAAMQDPDSGRMPA